MTLMNHLLANLPMVSDIFTATADGTFATLHHMAGIVEIQVKGSIEIYDIKLDVYNSTPDKNLCKDFDVNFDDEGNVSTVEKTSDSSRSSMSPTINPTSSNKLALSETGQSLFFPALPGTYNKVIIYYAKDGSAGWSTGELGTLKVQRGKINKKSTAVTIE